MSAPPAIKDWHPIWDRYVEYHVSRLVAEYFSPCPEQIEDLSKWALTRIHGAMTNSFDPFFEEAMSRHIQSGFPYVLLEIGVIAYALKVGIVWQRHRHHNGWTYRKIGEACDDALTRLGYVATRTKPRVDSQVCFVQSLGAPHVLAIIRGVLLDIGRPVYAIELPSITGVVIEEGDPGPRGFTVAEASQIIPKRFWWEELQVEMQRQMDAIAVDVLMQ